MPHATLGERLRLFIMTRRLSIKDFAGHCGVPYRTIQEYLVDKRKPGADHLGRMAQCGLDVNWLLTGNVGGMMRDIFENLPEIHGPLAAHPEMARHAMLRCFDAMDAHAREVQALTPLRSQVYGAFSLFDGVVKVFSRDEERINRLVDEGWAPAELVDFIIGLWGGEVFGLDANGVARMHHASKPTEAPAGSTSREPNEN
jgi:hypothetical protein